VTIELKNDIEINGTMLSVDSNLNIALSNISVNDQDKFPQLVNILNIPQI
jgi:U6 snRNA-associated Sm-like protein LSm2